MSCRTSSTVRMPAMPPMASLSAWTAARPVASGRRRPRLVRVSVISRQRTKPAAGRRSTRPRRSGRTSLPPGAVDPDTACMTHQRRRSAASRVTASRLDGSCWRPTSHRRRSWPPIGPSSWPAATTPRCWSSASSIRTTSSCRVGGSASASTRSAIVGERRPAPGRTRPAHRRRRQLPGLDRRPGRVDRRRRRSRRRSTWSWSARMPAARSVAS